MDVPLKFPVILFPFSWYLPGVLPSELFTFGVIGHSHSYSFSKLSLPVISLLFQNTDASKLWAWIENTFVPSLKPQYWYGPFIDKREEEMWTEEALARKTRRGRGQKLSSKRKGGGSYSDDYVESFDQSKRFPKSVTADRGLFYVVGVARLRQLRVKNGRCPFIHWGLVKVANVKR